MRSLPLKALLFIALSGVAVPACQHYEAGGKQEREQARSQVTAPADVGAGAAFTTRPPCVELTGPPKPEGRRWKLDAYS